MRTLVSIEVKVNAASIVWHLPSWFWRSLTGSEASGARPCRLPHCLRTAAHQRVVPIVAFGARGCAHTSARRASASSLGFRLASAAAPCSPQQPQDARDPPNVPLAVAGRARSEAFDFPARQSPSPSAHLLGRPSIHSGISSSLPAGIGGDDLSGRQADCADELLAFLGALRDIVSNSAEGSDQRLKGLFRPPPRAARGAAPPVVCPRPHQPRWLSKVGDELAPGKMSLARLVNWRLNLG